MSRRVAVTFLVSLLTEVTLAASAGLVLRSATDVQDPSWFTHQYAQITAIDGQIESAAAAAAADVDSEQAQRVYINLVNRCLYLVAAYNAEAIKVPRNRWNPVLPQRIDGTDPATDCTESRPQDGRST